MIQNDEAPGSTSDSKANNCLKCGTSYSNRVEWVQHLLLHIERSFPVVVLNREDIGSFREKTNQQSEMSAEEDTEMTQNEEVETKPKLNNNFDGLADSNNITSTKEGERRGSVSGESDSMSICSSTEAPSKAPEAPKMVVKAEVHAQDAEPPENKESNGRRSSASSQGKDQSGAEEEDDDGKTSDGSKSPPKPTTPSLPFAITLRKSEDLMAQTNYNLIQKRLQELYSRCQGTRLTANMPSNIVGNPNVYKATLQGSKSHPDSKSTQQGSSSFQNATPVGPEKATTALPNVTGTQEEYDSTPKLSECETQSSGEVLSSAVNAEIDAVLKDVDFSHLPVEGDFVGSDEINLQISPGDCDWTDNVLESGKAQEIPLLPPQLPQPTKKPTPKPKISDYFLATPKSGANSSKITTQRPTNVRNASSDSNSVSLDVKNTGISKHSDKTDSLTPSKRYTSFEGVLEQESLKSRADENSFQPNRRSMGAKAIDRIQAGSSRLPQDGGNTSISRVQCENALKACDPQPRSRDLNPVMTERIERPKAALKPIMTDAGSKMSRNVISRFPADGNQSDALEGNRFGRPQVEKVHSGLDESTNARDSTSGRNVDEIFNKVRRNLNSAVSLSVSTSRSRSTFGGSLWEQPPKDNPGIRAELVMNSGKSASVDKNPGRDCQIRPASSAVQSNLQDQSPACRDAPSDSAKHRNIHLKSPEEPASQDTAEDGRNLDQKQPSKSSRNPKKRWCAEAQQQSENFPSQEDVADFESGQLQSSANISRNTLKDATISDCGLLSTRTPSSNAAADSEDAFDSRPLQSTRNPCRNAVEFKPLQAKRNPSKHAVDSKDAVDSVQLQRTRNPPRHSAKTVAYSEDAVDSKPLQSTRNPCRNAVDSEPLRSNRNSSKAAVDSEDSVNFEPSQSSRNPSRNSSKAAVNSEDAVNSEPSQSSRNPSRNSSKAAVNSEDAVDSRQLRSTGNPFRNAAADSEDAVYSKPLQSARNPSRNSSKAAVGSEDAVDSRRLQSTRNPSGYPASSETVSNRPEIAVSSPTYAQNGQISIKDVRKASVDGEHGGELQKPAPNSAINPKQSSISKARMKARNFSSQEAASELLQNSGHSSRNPASFEGTLNLGIAGDSTMLPHQGLGNSTNCSAPMWDLGDQISLSLASMDKELTNEEIDQIIASAMEIKQSYPSNQQLSGEIQKPELAKSSNEPRKDFDEHDDARNLQNPSTSFDSAERVHNLNSETKRVEESTWESQSISESSDVGSQSTHSRSAATNQLREDSDIGSNLGDIKTPLLPPFVEAFPTTSASSLGKKYKDRNQNGGRQESQKTLQSTGFKQPAQRKVPGKVQRPNKDWDRMRRRRQWRRAEMRRKKISLKLSKPAGSRFTVHPQKKANILDTDSNDSFEVERKIKKEKATEEKRDFLDGYFPDGLSPPKPLVPVAVTTHNAPTPGKSYTNLQPLNPIHQHPSGVKNNPNLSRTRPKPVTKKKEDFPNGDFHSAKETFRCALCPRSFVTAAELDAHAAAEGHIVCSMSEACASLSFASSAALSHHQAMVHQAPAQTTAVQRLAAQVERLPQTFGNYPPPPAAYGGPPPFSIPPAPYSGPKLGSQVVLTPMSAPVVSAPPQPNLPNLPGIQVTKRPAPPPVDSSPSKMIRGEDNVPSIRLPDSITLVKSQPAAPPQNAVADMLATRGITMVASGSRAGQAPVASIQPVTPAKRLPNVPSAISIVPSRSQPTPQVQRFAVPPAPAARSRHMTNLGTVDLTREDQNGRPRGSPGRPMAANAPRRFSCTICDKVYPTGESLQAHMAVHGSNKPGRYMCDICRVVYTNEAKLAHHKKTVHAIRSASDTEMVIPICDLNQPGVKEKLLQCGIRHVVQVQSIRNANDTAAFGLPIIPIDLARNEAYSRLDDLGASNILSLGNLRNIYR